MALVQVCKVKNELNICSEYIDTLKDQICENKKVLSWFKQLCEHLTKLILSISDLHKELKGKVEKGNRDTLLLYLSQLVTCLSLLINVFVQESDVRQVLREARLCAKKRIAWCLDGIQETLNTNKSILDPSGSFIKWMDSALDTIGEISGNADKTSTIKICNDARVLFEEVLSHAMSIAQVALKEDCKIIRGSSQTVLESLDSLSKEILKLEYNPAMVNLFVDACTDKLCALERRVNTAVLKLSLKVFSEYTFALEAIHIFCFERNNKERMEDLDTLVADFDLHVDRIMQIGLFAVSCTTCNSRGIKIRSCLASLEALECELVPALTAVLIDPSVYNKNLALLLENHWRQQADILRILIFHIIDPFAFLQVIHEENKQIVEGISESFKIKGLINKKCVELLIEQSQVLLHFINVVLKEEKEATDDVVNTKQKFIDFKHVLHEVESAANILLVEKIKPDSNFRILKRCKILLTTTKKLWHCFIEEGLENDLKTEKETSLNTSNASKPSTGNAFLDHIINRGKQILKDRSVLYKSSLKNDTFSVPVSAFKKMHLREQNKAIPLSKLVHLRKLSFMSCSVKNDSLAELQLTDILNELNNMTNTFN